MRIHSVRIENLRSFKDTTVELGDYTCLVGPNGSGKSAILCALNIFFRETSGCSTDLTHLDSEDFHLRNTEKPITITVTFTDLDSEAQNDFSDYFRQGQLVVSAIAKYEPSTGKAEVKQFGQRLGMVPFKPFFKAYGDNAKVPDLKKVYADIRKSIPSLPAPGTKDTMYQTLKDYESAHWNECELIPSEDQFYGVSKGANRLAKYIQWVFVPAVKDAASEQLEAKETSLGKLLARTVRAKIKFSDKVKELREKAQEDYDRILSENQSVLNEISGSLRKRMTDWSHPDAMLRLEWFQDPSKSVRVDEPWAKVIAGEGPFEGELARFGHGFQRSYLLAILQELAGCDDPQGPKLILACEEPELFQHPPQARHLFNVFQRLSRGNSQVIVCTHSPYFVSGESFEDIRMVNKSDAVSRVAHVRFDAVANSIATARGEKPEKPSATLAKIHQALESSISEMFFTPRLILVEGLEDYAYIATYMNLMDMWDEYRRCGCHIVPTGSKSTMIRPLAIAKALGIPTFVVFDSDAEKPEKNGSRKKHEKDNIALLRLCGVTRPDPLPSATFWGDGVTMWASEIGKVVENDIGGVEWAKYCAIADDMYGYAGNLQKNMLHIGTCLENAWNDGKRSNSLENLCNRILGFAKISQTT